MKKYICLVFCGLLSVSIMSQSVQEAYLQYIEKYKKQALSEQESYGIPASITLAQGLLESNAGRSELAQKANNHFGIKCAGGWTGDTYTHDDETKNECFRKYKHAEQSFEDHSQFLLRDRYKPLFELQITDYKGWAHGLKRCGYATDPGYAGKLINIIELYGLDKLETSAKEDNKVDKTSKQNNQKADKQKNKTEDKKSKENKSAKENKSSKDNKKKDHNSNVPSDGGNTTNPFNSAKGNDLQSVEKEVQDDIQQEDKVQPKKRKRDMGRVNLMPEHEVKRINGSKYIVARQGDTFESLAYEYNIYERSLRRYNDIVNPRYELQAGDKVFLQMKRSKAQRKYKRYFVRRGENIWNIAQDKGMRLKMIYKLNGIETGQNVTINQELRLR